MTRRRPQVPRALLAWILGLAMALGAVSPHGGAVEHGANGLKGTLVAESAGHPREARHMEPSQLRFHPGCSACLLGLQTIGVAPLLPAHLPIPSPEADSPRLLASSPAAPAHPCGSPRAPPAFRVSV